MWEAKKLSMPQRKAKAPQFWERELETLNRMASLTLIQKHKIMIFLNQFEVRVANPCMDRS